MSTIYGDLNLGGGISNIGGKATEPRNIASQFFNLKDVDMPDKHD